MTVRKPGGEALVGKVSSGRSGFETPTGIFNVQRMDTEHFSDEYDQAPMPYAIFFSRGLAIHGTYERGLGHPVSHGCVRLSVQNARDLYSWVEQYGATIEIAGSADEMVAQDDESYGRQRRARNKGCLLSSSGIDTLTTITCQYRWSAYAVPSKINRLPLSSPIRNGFENAYTGLTCQCWPVAR
jgi:hypothetical protein